MHLYGAFFISYWFFLPRGVCRELRGSPHGDKCEAVLLDREKSMSLMPETTPLVRTHPSHFQHDTNGTMSSMSCTDSCLDTEYRSDDGSLMDVFWITFYTI